MPKKDWTPEARAAFSEKMKRLAAEKKAQKTAAEAETLINEPVEEPKQPDFEDVSTAQSVPTDDQGDIMRRLQQLEADGNMWRELALKLANQAPTTATSSMQVGVNGMVGTLEKYKLDPKHYPNPSDRLAKEPRLQRFAFGMNYELDWQVSVSQYKTLDGINTKEPKFTIELHRIVMDEDTGEPTKRRYTICRAVFHEDPDSALLVARDNGFDVKDYEEKVFLDEMRYLRIRDWLLEAFYPPRPSMEKKNKKEVVINGKLVEMFEINSEQSESIPFSELKNKL